MRALILTVFIVLYLLNGLYIFFKSMIAIGGIVGYRNIIDTYHPNVNFTFVMVIAFCYTVFLWPIGMFRLIRIKNSEE